jgi:rhodanese-related sulfurtransferase
LNLPDFSWSGSALVSAAFHEVPLKRKQTMQRVSPHALKAMHDDGEELALVDLREELTFSRGHLLFARCIPLSRLELEFPRLVPRRSTRVVLCDENDGLIERAGSLLASSGYVNLQALAGGIETWSEAGFELFSGVNVPSKAFGEFIEHASATPSIAPEQLHRLLCENADVVVLDSRPFDEYRRVCIPTAVNVPGAELVLRVRDMAPSPHTTVVVNCAGRTRSIIGAQSLINSGVPNRIVALRNGTMGWSLAGYECERGKTAQAPSVSAYALAWAKSAAGRVARQCGIERIDLATLSRFAQDGARTLYLFDVRSPVEYQAGHLSGARSAPGGQLMQATDHYVGTLGARIVLVDEHEVRALMTASWLRQMGWRDVFTLAERGSETEAPSAPVLGPPPPDELGISCAELGRLLEAHAATVIDLSLSRDYRRGHIPGAWFAIRSRLSHALKKVRPRGTLVLTSDDGVVAGLASREAAGLSEMPVRYLRGGNAAWKGEGRPHSSEPMLMADEPLDTWLKPYERPNETRAAMRDYLAWEIDLLARIGRDGSAHFHHVPI